MFSRENLPGVSALHLPWHLCTCDLVVRQSVSHLQLLQKLYQCSPLFNQFYGRRHHQNILKRNLSGRVVMNWRHLGNILNRKHCKLIGVCTYRYEGGFSFIYLTLIFNNLFCGLTQFASKIMSYTFYCMK